MHHGTANVTEPWLVLITRIGVGISRDAYYRHRIRVAELALAGSLRAQTDTSFTWVLVRDVRAPTWVDDEFERLAKGMSFDIWRRDPTVEGINPVNRPAVRAMIAQRPTILSRCDDDDFLHRSYVGRARAELAGRKPPSAITFVQGGYLFGKDVYLKEYPWIGTGLAVLPDEQAQITPYRFKHTDFGTEMQRRGFEAREIRNTDPMWLRTVSAMSDSASRRHLRPRFWQRPATVEPAEFGATHESFALLAQTLATAPVSTNPQPGQSPLAQKRALAEEIRAIRKTPVLSAEDEAEIQRLTNALYDL